MFESLRAIINERSNARARYRTDRGLFYLGHEVGSAAHPRTTNHSLVRLTVPWSFRTKDRQRCAPAVIRRIARLRPSCSRAMPGVGKWSSEFKATLRARGLHLLEISIAEELRR